jgi:hypothetical protein
VSSNRGENIPSVEGSANRLPPENGVGDGNSLNVCPEFSLLQVGVNGGGRPGRCWTYLIYYVAQNTVIRCYKEGRRRFQDNGFPLTADAGVNYSYVDCSFREIRVSRADDESSLKDILRLDRMTDIDDNRFWVDGEDYPFHTGYISIASSEIGGQGYHWSHGGFCLQLGGEPDNPDGKNYEQNNQGDSELKQVFFHASPRSVDTIRLAEYASKPAAAHLEQNYSD